MSNTRWHPNKNCIFLTWQKLGCSFYCPGLQHPEIMFSCDFVHSTFLPLSFWSENRSCCINRGTYYHTIRHSVRKSWFNLKNNLLQSLSYTLKVSITRNHTALVVILNRTLHLSTFSVNLEKEKKGKSPKDTKCQYFVHSQQNDCNLQLSIGSALVTKLQRLIYTYVYFTDNWKSVIPRW